MPRYKRNSYAGRRARLSCSTHLKWRAKRGAKLSSTPTPDDTELEAAHALLTLCDDSVSRYPEPQTSITSSSALDDSVSRYPESLTSITSSSALDDSDGCAEQQAAPATTLSGEAHEFVHWRYETRRRCVSRKEFRRLTGVNQENFEVLYSFLGGDEVCDNLKYAYGAATPRKKKPRSLVVNRLKKKTCPSEMSLPTWKDTTRMTSKDKLFMTLVRLRTGLSVQDTASLFGISKTQVSTIFFVWVQLLYLQLKRLHTRMCVTRHNQPAWKIAPCYRRYKNFRIVVDTTEIRIQAPKHNQQQGNTWSEYKSGNVILFMVGTDGWGNVSFISPGFEGSMSDRKIFLESGLVNLLEPGDLVMSDRGFRISDVMDEMGVTVVHPPFTKKNQPLCPEDLMLTKRIGSDRSHVERVIRKIKAFNILKRVTNKMLPILDQMFYICGCLVKFDANNVR